MAECPCLLQGDCAPGKEGTEVFAGGLPYGSNKGEEGLMSLSRPSSILQISSSLVLSETPT